MLFELLVGILLMLTLLIMWIFGSLMGRRPMLVKASFIMLPACAIACLSEVIQLFSTNLVWKTSLYDISTLLFIGIFTSFLFISLELTRIVDPYTKRVLALLLVVPAITTFAVLTNPWTHLFTQAEHVVFSGAINGPILITSAGPIGILWTAYFDIVGSIFAFILFRHVYREESKKLALAFLAGVVVIHSYVIASYFVPTLNIVYPDILAYSATAVILYLYSFRYGLFDLAPIGRKVMLDGIEDIIVTVDSRGEITDINRSGEKYLGRSLKQLMYQPFDRALPQMAPYLDASPRHVGDLPLEFTDPYGRSFEVKVKEFKYGQSSKYGNLVILHDMTERKRVEEALRKAEAQEKIAESERRYRTVVDNQTESIVSFRPDGEITFINKVLENFLKEMGRPISDLNVQSFLDDKYRMELREIMNSMTPSSPVGEFEMTVPMPDGAVQYILWRGSGMFDEAGRLKEVQAVGINITERHRFQQEMAKNQRLESLGVLAGGIAHDFNNMLASMVSNIEIALMDQPEGRGKHHLEESVRSAMRARRLTQQLLTFSKGGQPIKEVVDLTALVRTSVDFVLTGSNVAAVYDIEDGLHCISADPGQVEQVINNLVVNALQAMPQGGHLSIGARNVMYEVGAPPGISGPCVRMDITDQGMGISQENINKIFDPFFTTKRTGSGLGLATVQSIIRNHGGQVLVDSTLGVGTTFSIILPAEVMERPASSSAKEVASPHHTGRVLVMDDEAPIREVLTVMLEEFGYRPTCVTCGEEAIPAYREAMSRGERFDIVIMDLTIPGGMGGKDAVKEVLAIDKDAKVIVSSGYSNDPIMAHPEEYGFTDVLPKPFNMEEFKIKLSTIMAGASGKPVTNASGMGLEA